MAGQSPFDELLDQACIVWGFCGGYVDGKARHVTDRIPRAGTVTADQFVDWHFWADGMDVADDKWAKHRAALRAAFVSVMGADSVDATLLQGG